MKLRELFFKAKNQLDAFTTIEDIYWLIEDIYHYSRGEVPMHYEDEIDDFVFFSLFERLKKEPIQYVLGYGYFLGEKFTVSKDVLIPRNETEELVVFLKNIIKTRGYRTILDIGVGSGAILLSIEKELKKENININGLGVDISSKALEIAHINKEKFNLKSKLMLSDVYENVNSKFDVIVSNPPYIDEEEFVEERVKENEPHIALYASDKGMYVYKKILKDASLHINEKGIIAFEISPEREEDIRNYADMYVNYEKIEFVKDINGFTRFCLIYVK